MTWLIILSFVVALGFGVWLGRPRPFDQSLDEIDERLQEKGQHARVKRHRTVLSLLQRNSERASHQRRRSSRTPFRMK